MRRDVCTRRFATLCALYGAAAAVIAGEAGQSRNGGGFRRAAFAICGIRATANRVAEVEHQPMRRQHSQRLVLLGVGEAFVAVEPAQCVEMFVVGATDQRRTRLRNPAQFHDPLGRQAGEGARRLRLARKRALERLDRAAPARVEADRHVEPVAARILRRARPAGRRSRADAIPPAITCGCGCLVRHCGSLKPLSPGLAYSRSPIAPCKG
jgi:hypothetical protein